MWFRQLIDRESSTYTYLLGDPESREAVLIDPVLENVERDLGLIDDLGLRLKFAIDTHVHADHVTALGSLRARTGCKTVLSERAGVGVADVYVKQGDRLSFGARSLEARETPGHTNGCMTYVLDDQSMAFTGDALLIRGSGRTDFQQGDAKTLYRSVHEQILSLPEACLLYPGHDYEGRLVTSVDEERRLNPRLGGGKTEADFVAFMDARKLPYPRKIDVALPANLRLGLHDLPVDAEPKDPPRWAPIERSAGGVPEIAVEWIYGNQGKVRLVDVREPDELVGELGHVEGIEHVPLAEVAARAKGWAPAQPIALVCRSGGRSGHAAIVLESMGFDKVASMRGGMIEWSRVRLPTTRAPLAKTSKPEALSV